ncbi:hypothetical protein FGRMN_6010 [Fusarium graminum]|nr:hypothetical protein FGRMN_6010 [Fusarium graminum]
MPSATEYFGATLTNFGPLTTTYTAPSSCLTATTDHIVYALENTIQAVVGSPKCDADPYGGCIPSGSVLDSMLDNNFGRQSGQGFQYYYSPGVYCPHGWTTAAVLAHGPKTDSEERSGFFTATPRTGWSDPVGMRQDEYWLNILEPSETVAFCCPSGWTGIADGNCRTSITPFASSEYSDSCNELVPESVEVVATVHTVDGEPWSKTQGILSALPQTWSVSRTMESLFWPEKTGLVIARNMAAVPLVFKASDVEVAKNATDSKDDDDKGGSEKADKNDAASTLPYVLGLAPVAALAVGLLTGAGLLMPW